MVNSNIEDNEPLEEAKEFIGQYWKLMVAVVVISLLSIYGWRYWQTHKTSNIEKQSLAFETLVSKLDANDPQTSEALAVFSEKTDSVYGVLGMLSLSKFYVENNRYDSAIAQLKLAEKKNKAKEVSPIISLRLARLYFQQKLFDEALFILNGVNAPEWTAFVNAIRGDIFTEKKSYEEANQAYQLALSSALPGSTQAKELGMKLNNLQYLASVEPTKSTEENQVGDK